MDKFKNEITIILDEIVEMLVKKNHDYGDKNLRKYGILGIIIRMSDKMERIKNIITSGRNEVGESVNNEFGDIIGYCTQAIRMLNEHGNLKNILFGDIKDAIKEFDDEDQS